MKANLKNIDEAHKKSCAIERSCRSKFIELVQKNAESKDKALSVSCGNGKWDYDVLSVCPGINITATDIVKNPVKKRDVQKLNKLGVWRFKQVKPEEKLNFKSASFDAIFHCDVIEHVEKPYLFLSEQHRVLKKGGVLIFSTPNLLRPANIGRLLLGLLKFPLKFYEDTALDEYVHIQEFTCWNLKNLLKEIGFQNIKVSYRYLGFNKYIKIADDPNSSKFKHLSHYLFVIAQK